MIVVNITKVLTTLFECKTKKLNLLTNKQINLIYFAHIANLIHIVKLTLGHGIAGVMVLNTN